MRQSRNVMVLSCSYSMVNCTLLWTALRHVRKSSTTWRPVEGWRRKMAKMSSTYFLMNFGVRRFFSCTIDKAFSSVYDIQMLAMVTIRDKPNGPESWAEYMVPSKVYWDVRQSESRLRMSSRSSLVLLLNVVSSPSFCMTRFTHSWRGMDGYNAVAS